MADIPFPRGVRDLMPNEALFKKTLVSRIEYIFRLFGFLTIDTPSFEALDVLNAKSAIGGEAKLIYQLSDDKLGLRYDHTVSLARYIAMHNDLPKPFRRYYVGNVWRREEPQKMRYRELTQADVDIVGGNRAMADAEVIAVASAALENVGVDYKVCLNDRQIAESVLGKFGLNQDKKVAVMRIIDKLDKSGEEGIVSMLMEMGLDSSLVDQIVAFVSMKGSNEEKLSYVEKLMGDNKCTKDIRDTLNFLADYGLAGRMSVDYSITRGLDYYTGIVFEFKNASDARIAIGGGGRYDELIGLYSNGKSVPAVGVSLGIDRIMEMLGASSSIEYTYAKVFVADVKEENYHYALKVANGLRASAIPTDINIADRNLTNQFAYANSVKSRFVVIVGDAEEKLNKLKLRDLMSGTEEILSLDDAIKKIKSEIGG